MSSRKPKKKASDQVNEPLADYAKKEIVFFKSFDEQHAYEMKEMSLLTPIQILVQLRQFINIAYGMHGYNPDKIPQIHTIRIIENTDEHI